MVGYIYLNTDLKTGNQYAGKHHYDKEGELDPNYHGSGVLWTKVLKKRPKELIKEEYIKTCYSEEEMNSDEQYYIEFFDTLYPNGYNLTKGGDGGILCEETRRKLSNSHKGKIPPNKGKPHSDETKKKISEALKEKFLNDEDYRKKISETKKGRPAYNKGKPMSEEQKKKLKNGKCSKKVLQFTLDGEFVREWPSTHECGRNGFDRGFISACCNGKHKSAYGFKWCYA